MSKRSMRRPAAAPRALALACAIAMPVLSAAHAAHAAPVVSHRIAEVAARLASPPADARPLTRWWWFGPAVAKPELEREILAMKEGGFGGFEIQPVYPMELDDAARAIKNVPYLSPEFLDAVSFANRTARANGLRVDMTLASGWPYGGPHIGIHHAAARLRVATVELPAGAASYAPPVVMNGETLVAAFVGVGSAKAYDSSALALVTPNALPAGRASIAAAAAPRVLVFYIATRTGQQVKRAALGAEGFVLDHLSRGAVDHHLRTVAEPLMKAFGQQPPHAVFSDSLEVYGTDWTDDFLAEFKQRRGYDILPHLPGLFSGKDKPIDDRSGAVRRDWALTQTELVNERYLTPMNSWAKAHGTLFRSQTYGEPAVSMSSNRLVDLPEGEGAQHRSFSFTRLATSAGHLYGRPVISAETWTWLNSPAFSATPLDMKAEADRMLLSGVNLFVAHGWPYTPPGTVEPGYAFYAAAVFNDHNPWWNVMPDVNGYLTRMSYLMRQGEPANQVAVFLPNDDVYASLVPGKVSLSADMHKHVTPELTEQILDAGHNLDYVDAESVLALGVKHPVLVMPHVTRLAPEVIDKLAAYVRAGGKIIAVGATPSLAPGFLDAQRISARVAAASKALFVSSPNVRVVANDAAVGAALGAALAPDLKVSSQQSEVGFVRRKLRDADIYFIANTGNGEVRATASVGVKRAHAAWLDPDSGKLTRAAAGPEHALNLAPYESRVLVLSDAPLAASEAPRLAPPAVLLDLGRDWKVSFPAAAGQGSGVHDYAQLRSWTDNEATRHFSGVAVYTKEVQLGAAQLAGQHVVLDFGPGTALVTTPKVPAGMRAMLESPVREAAQVYVNGKRAGAVWHPPYRVDVTRLLAPGKNRIEVRVANLAVNTLAGHALPDYRLLSARFGQRFVPQDTELIAPRPAGMLGPVTLMGEKIL